MKRSVRWRTASAAAALLLAAGMAAAEAVTEAPQTRTAAGFSDERPTGGPRAAGALRQTEWPAGTELSRERTPPSARATLQSCCAFRIWDAATDLFYDDDGDGHYHYLRVIFDADTDYFAADVYARLYLSRNGGPWLLYYESDYFTIRGSSAFDDYEVETELVSGYPRGYYDVLIELYDEFDVLVAEFGPYDSSALSLLPLEDLRADGSGGRPVVVSHGGGGSSGIVLLLALLLGVWLRGLNASRATLRRASRSADRPARAAVRAADAS